MSAACAFCNGRADDGDYHSSCLLRQALGGIGHLLNCVHWCIGVGDIDAGMSPYESGLCVQALVRKLGVQTALNGPLDIPLDTVRSWAGLETS